MRPEDYPWEQAGHPGLLVGARLVPVAWDEVHPERGAVRTPSGVRSVAGVLRLLGAEPMEHRTLVVAVGSNGSAMALGRKLSRARVSGVVPMVPVAVDGLGVGHSAHLARRGYVPAAPHHDHRGSARVVTLFLDWDQLNAVDATEPNYRRVWLSATDYPLRPGLAADGFWVYESRWGVLGTNGRPLPLGPQHGAVTMHRQAGGGQGDGALTGWALLSARTPSSRSRRQTW